MAFTEISCNSWEYFVIDLEKLKDEKAKLCKETELYISDYIYRGQSDYLWSLQTTLERHAESTRQESILKLEEYYKIICRIKSSIETITKEKWDIISLGDHKKFLEKYDINWSFYGYNFLDYSHIKRLETYFYYIYLRHHGFPSPLLDWTRSPYIAAYFAFRNAKPITTKYVSIYVYQKHRGDGELRIADELHIDHPGHYNVTTHPRHYHQQSEYTTCIKPMDKELQFVNHQEYFEKNQEPQDFLWKFNIPASERTKVLAYLDQHNINDFTLFGSPESLMKTMAYREIDLRNDDS